MTLTCMSGDAHPGVMHQTRPDQTVASSSVASSSVASSSIASSSVASSSTRMQRGCNEDHDAEAQDLADLTLELAFLFNSELHLSLFVLLISD